MMAEFPQPDAMQPEPSSQMTNSNKSEANKSTLVDREVGSSFREMIARDLANKPVSKLLGKIDRKKSLEEYDVFNITYCIGERRYQVSAGTFQRAQQQSSSKLTRNTNSTSSKYHVLLDSGFGGKLLIGENSLKFYNVLKNREGKTATFIFGAGSPVRTNKIVLLRGLGEAYVVPGNLSCIAGREWLAARNAIMNFSSDSVSLDGMPAQYPAHLLDSSTLIDAVGGQEDSAVSSVAGKGHAGPGVFQGEHEKELRACRDGTQVSRPETFYSEVDELNLPVNLVFVLNSAEVSDQELEDAVLRGWLSTKQDSHEQNSPTVWKSSKILFCSKPKLPALLALFL